MGGQITDAKLDHALGGVQAAKALFEAYNDVQHFNEVFAQIQFCITDVTTPAPYCLAQMVVSAYQSCQQHDRHCMSVANSLNEYLKTLDTYVQSQGDAVANNQCTMPQERRRL